MRALIGTTAALALLAASAASSVPAASAGPVAPIGSVGVFEPYRPGASAITYAPDLVPVGARAAVIPLPVGGRTVVTLLTRGLLPGRHYGAHVHTNPCGPAPADAGPHYQDRPDPVQPSVDPAYANPTNEIWLDFTTDPRGSGAAITVVPWRVAGEAGRSVVVHAQHTATGPGEAGTAGPRLACLDVDF